MRSFYTCYRSWFGCKAKLFYTEFHPIYWLLWLGNGMRTLNSLASKCSELSIYCPCGYLAQFWRRMGHFWLIGCEFNHSDLISRLHFTKAQSREKINKFNWHRLVDTGKKWWHVGNWKPDDSSPLSCSQKRTPPCLAYQLPIQSVGFRPVLDSADLGLELQNSTEAQ